jgi:hypothetical protein
MVGRPTLVYPGNPNRGLEYSEAIYNYVKDAGVATGGMVEIKKFNELKTAYWTLTSIQPETIQHPAFAVKAGDSRNGLQALLDRIEIMIRAQLHIQFDLLEITPPDLLSPVRPSVFQSFWSWFFPKKPD